MSFEVAKVTLPIEHMLDQEVNDITEEDQENLFMDFIDDCYNAETRVAFLTVSTAWTLKRLDPMAFEIGMHEYFSEEAHIIIGDKLYSIGSIERWISNQLNKEHIAEKVGVRA